jgi:hypothetical protein
MRVPPRHVPSPLPGVLGNPQVRVALLAAAALLVEAVVAKNVLDVHMSFFSLLAPFWVFTAYKVSGRRGRISEILASVLVIGVTVAVLLSYAV